MFKSRLLTATALTLVLGMPAFAQDTGGAAASVGAGTTGVVSLGSSVDSTVSTSTTGTTSTGGDVNTGVNAGVGIGVMGTSRPVVTSTNEGNAQVTNSGGGAPDNDDVGNREFQGPSEDSPFDVKAQITGDFKSMDADNDQYVTSAEFRSTAPNSPIAFSQLDIDGDNRLSEAEMKAANE